MRHSLIRAALAPALALTLAAGAPLAAAQTSPDTLVVGMGAIPRHLNSAVQSGVATGVPAAQIFASPLRFDSGWQPQPYLAETWSFQDDGKSLLLKLVPGATFHDGKPITSEDVAFSIMSIKANHPFQSMFAPVERVDTPAPNIAVIRMSQPHPAILLAMSPPFCPIIPKHVFGDGKDLKTHPANNAPVGSGPFRVVEVKPNEAIVLERYPGFFIKDRPKMNRLVFRLMQDVSSQTVALERGEIDLLPGSVTLSQRAQLAKSPNVVLFDKGGDAIGPIGWLAFNLRKKPFDDVRVRQAIAYGIDRDFIVRVLHRGATRPATGPIDPRSPFYSDAVEPYKFNPQKAMQLLDAAGLKPDARGVRLAMTVDFLPNTPDNSQTIAEYLKPQLKKIGVDVTVRTSPDFPTWARRVSNFEFDATVDGAFNYGDPVIGVHRTYLSSNIRQGVIWSNTQSYANPAVDALLAQATVERDADKRKRIYADFQKQVVADVPVAFTHVWAQTVAMRKDLTGMPESIWLPMTPFDTVSRRR